MSSERQVQTITIFHFLRIIVLFVCLLCAVAYSGTTSAEAKKKGYVPTTFYYQLEDFVINIELTEGEAGFGLARIEMYVTVPNELDMLIIEEHSPYMRNDILELLQGRNMAELSQADAREKLREDSLAIIVRILKNEAGYTKKVDVLIPKMIVE